MSFRENLLKRKYSHASKRKFAAAAKGEKKSAANVNNTFTWCRRLTDWCTYYSFGRTCDLLSVEVILQVLCCSS